MVLQQQDQVFVAKIAIYVMDHRRTDFKKKICGQSMAFMKDALGFVDSEILILTNLELMQIMR